MHAVKYAVAGTVRFVFFVCVVFPLHAINTFVKRDFYATFVGAVSGVVLSFVLLFAQLMAPPSNASVPCALYASVSCMCCAWLVGSLVRPHASALHVEIDMFSIRSFRFVDAHVVGHLLGMVFNMQRFVAVPSSSGITQASLQTWCTIDASVPAYVLPLIFSLVGFLSSATDPDVNTAPSHHERRHVNSVLESYREASVSRPTLDDSEQSQNRDERSLLGVPDK